MNAVTLKHPGATENMSGSQNFIRQINKKCLMVVGIFIILFCAEYCILESATKANQNQHAVINKTGYQRMLTQKIAFLSTKLIYAQKESERQRLRSQIQDEAKSLKIWHDSLLAQCNPRAKEKLEALYFSPKGGLDGEVRGFVSAVNRLTGEDARWLTPENINYQTISQAGSHNFRLLILINQALKILEQDIEHNQKNYILFINAMLLVNFLVLLVTYQFVMRPMLGFIRANHDAMEKNQNELQLLKDIMLEINQSDDLTSALEAFLAKVSQMTGWVFGQAWLPSADQALLECHAAWFDERLEVLQEFRNKNESFVFEIGKGVPGRVWQAKKPVWVMDVRTDSNFPRAALAQSAGLQTCLGIPILAEGKVVTVIEFFMFETRTEDAHLIEVITAVASQLGNAIQKKKMQEALQQAHKHLESLVEERTIKLLQAHNQLKDELENRKHLELQMVQTEKLATVGQLAAGVAHEINNPLGFIMSNLETLKGYIQGIKRFFNANETLAEQVRQDTAHEEMMNTISEIGKIRKSADLDFVLEDIDFLLKESIDGTNRMSDIVKNLKNFARADELGIKESDLNGEIETTLKIIWNELKYKCTVNKHYGDIPPLRCNAGQLNQVFMNLLVNAAHAMEDKGEISISTESNGSQVEIRISDTGKGISEENMKKIFDPFFTTKPVGKGTGLGLSISYDIIKKHGGDMTVKSEVGKGTTFTITLPISKGADDNE